MDNVRTAVIGVGHLGRHHARWYDNIKDAELVGVYDTDREKAIRVGAEYGVVAFEQLTDLFGQVDAVSVVVPTSRHYEVASQLLANGIHCLVEKPITATVDEARKLTALAKEHHVLLTVGHIERFNPAVQALKKHRISPRFIEAHRLAAFDPRGTDVAVIFDLMIHDIDLALHLIGSPVTRIEASAVSVISGTDDIANARLTFADGAVANLTASRISLRPMRKLRIFQKSGYFSLDLAEKRADVYRLADGTNTDEIGMRIPLGKSGHEIVYSKEGSRDDDALANELRAFVKAVQEGGPVAVTAEEATEALRVASEIERIGINGNMG
ncbi:MAG: Gfo/Idh/MocA family oxidoreductase [candidate division Zixibacteria bacterium]|nr:Gfo/Idh/MocA family oxidoreductase [candidate division Zixibacteria bacterium]